MLPFLLFDSEIRMYAFRVGAGEILGGMEMDGASVGVLDGIIDGMDDGTDVGDVVGAKDGRSLGATLGWNDTDG